MVGRSSKNLLELQKVKNGILTGARRYLGILVILCGMGMKQYLCRLDFSETIILISILLRVWQLFWNRRIK